MSTIHSSVRGMDVSSSLIRQLVSAGDMRRARWLLGRPFSILSTPAPGRGIGSRLTVPTINLAAYDGLVPATGVYVTRMQIAAGTPKLLIRTRSASMPSPTSAPVQRSPMLPSPSKATCWTSALWI